MEIVDLIVRVENMVTCRGMGKPKTGNEMSDVGLIRNAAVAIDGDRIIKVGPTEEILKEYKPKNEDFLIDAGGKTVMPGLIDSHTHPIFGGNRINEFIMRAQGATYQEIHTAGGGIQFTVDKTRKASDEELLDNAKKILKRMLRHGTTTIEAKSGYGLNTEEELRELRIIKKLAEESPLDVMPTFLGAHSIPREYKDNREEYVKIVIEEMMPRVKKEGLAHFVDVFCEEGAFNLDETRRILSAAKEIGFGLKLHAEEFTNMGSAVMAGEMGAISVDHLLKISDDDIERLARTDAILTLMPGTLFFLNYDEFAPARKIIDDGAKVALATDFNAGSCTSASMQMAMSLACIKMKMTPEEAINAAVYNAAFAVGMGDKIGSIEEGKQADLVIFDVDDYRLIPYYFGENVVDKVIKKGRVVVG